MKRYKHILLVLFCMLMTQLSFTQVTRVRFEQLDSLQRIDQRPVVVFLHTSWCKYCATMDNTTFKNRAVQDLLNQQFYFVSLNIEEKSPIHFRGHRFNYKPTGVSTGVHELAEQLGSIKGELAYPTTCFLNSDYEIVYQQQGFIKANEFADILQKLK